MYRVTKYFTDLQDNGYAYNEGDTFPRDGVTVTADRIKELSTSANRRGIAEAAEPVAEVAAEEAAPVEDEPRKRTRKHKES